MTWLGSDGSPEKIDVVAAGESWQSQCRRPMAETTQAMMFLYHECLLHTRRVGMMGGGPTTSKDNQKRQSAKNQKRRASVPGPADSRDIPAGCGAATNTASREQLANLARLLIGLMSIDCHKRIRPRIGLVAAPTRETLPRPIESDRYCALALEFRQHVAVEGRHTRVLGREMHGHEQRDRSVATASDQLPERISPILGDVERQPHLGRRPSISATINTTAASDVVFRVVEHRRQQNLSHRNETKDHESSSQYVATESSPARTGATSGSATARAIQ